ncbi:hypothetical protein ACVGVM_00930 [Pseudonocardia bannensis]|uniref:Uncharacterized protein n=1 Tax=Pseudonocardia bannensis TaxID=630973 RepID=A0A848DA33_9PSEU|nr:hypothetical protein [Pseudonocardia bannensis]NMH90063.1 hypothetical protein [Pseudonocardia bannensis]
MRWEMERSGVAAGVAAEYAEWVERVRATFEAVQYTCSHRLSDPGLAEQVSVQVIAGMVSRPTVFRYFGLPYSGRIARLAETRIAEADAGRLATVCGWAELRERLDSVPDEHREVLVGACIRGEDLATLAAGLSCDEREATARRDSTLAFMQELAKPGLPPAPDPDERG